MGKKIRFGMFGLDRGGDLVDIIEKAGAELVAVCERRPSKVAPVLERFPNVAVYDDFDEFIKYDMDAVMLVNRFNEHAPYAIKAMRAGKHVLSETISNITMAEGVELCRVKEETGMIYAFLENYPYMKPNLELGRIYKEGSLGPLVFAEGEYVHPMDPEGQNELAPGERHWRNWTPRTYYSTHALAPLMMMTDSLPTRVSAMASFQPTYAKGTATHVGDAAAIIFCQTDTNAVFRVTGWANWGPHRDYYRLCGVKGSIETHTGAGCGDVRLWYSSWVVPEGREIVQEYQAEWPDAALGELAKGCGHGGSDFFVIHQAIKAFETGTEPYFDVYRATTMASVAILAWRSILNNNACYDVPDFRKEEDRKKYEHDNTTPYPDENFKVNFPCSSKPYEPTAEDLAEAHKFWDEHMDYTIN